MEQDCLTEVGSQTHKAGSEAEVQNLSSYDT
jgi:hypothetical protein